MEVNLRDERIKQRIFESLDGPSRNAFEEHIRDLEAYLAGEDPVSKLMDRLRDKVAKDGLSSMSEPQRLYYAYNEFACCVVNGSVLNFFKEYPEEVRESYVACLRMLDEAELIPAYEDVRRRVLAGELDDDEFIEIDDALGPLSMRVDEFEPIMDEYADQHGLFD
ncbi:MAG: hypothetical protein GKR94_31250 [Gammaproteobacteria bacterium]|nr:hypothetical protein [Gammaproteobacteria bacterium]